MGNRRTFLGLIIAVTVSGLVAACGVKGPLYLPKEPESEEEKGEDEEKTSRRSPAPERAASA